MSAPMAGLSRVLRASISKARIVSGGARNFSLLKAYSSSLESNPILVKGVTAAVLSFTGDIICQLVVPYIKERGEKGAEAVNLSDYLDISKIDWQRSLKFSVLGITMNGILLHYW